MSHTAGHPLLLAALVLVAGCGATTTPSAPVSDTHPTPAAAVPPVSAPAAVEAPIAAVETAVEPEKNPPGDMPDSQVFVAYTSPTDGVTLQIPEGWARTEVPGGAQWIDKFDGVKVVAAPANAAPTAATAASTLVPALQGSGHAVEIGAVSAVTLPGGSAVRIDYHANSEPNAVTDKKVRLEASNYYYFHDGKLLTLTVWAPAGADNVDQWDLMSKSLRWP